MGRLNHTIANVIGMLAALALAGLFLAETASAQVIVPDRGSRNVFRYSSTYSGTLEYGPPFLGFAPASRLFHNRNYFRGPTSYYGVSVHARIISVYEMDEQMRNGANAVSNGRVGAVSVSAPLSQNQKRAVRRGRGIPNWSSDVQRYLRER